MERRRFLGVAAGAAMLAGAVSLFAQAEGTDEDAGRGEAAQWEIGPVIDGRNYSRGMPLHPEQTAEGWAFDFPGPGASDGHVHYLTRPTGSLAGALGIRLRYRIDAAEGTRFVPQEAPDRTALLSLFVQRQGDDWRMREGTQWYRWYAGPHERIALRPGVSEAFVPFDAQWSSVNGKPRAQAPDEFERALANAARVGFTLGSDHGLGHGVFATGPARLTVLSFEIVR